MAKAPKVAVLILFGLAVAGCGEDRPNSFSPEHKLAHGHVEGQVNELWVGRTLLRIPPDVGYTPVSTGRITKGRADSISFSLWYPQFHVMDTLNCVHILVRPGYEDPKVRDGSFKEKKWKQVVQRKDLGLLEYHQDVTHTAHGYITYVPMDDSIRTPKGSLLQYKCSGTDDGIVSCYTGLTLHDDLLVQYTLTAPLLPHWRVTHRDVLSFVNELIANEGI